MPIACALLMRRLPVSASRWSTVSRTPGFAHSDWFEIAWHEIAWHKHSSQEKQMTIRTGVSVLCGRCSSVLGWTALEPTREVLESDKSDVIPCRALDSLLRSARCGYPNTAWRRS